MMLNGFWLFIHKFCIQIRMQFVDHLTFLKNHVILPKRAIKSLCIWFYVSNSISLYVSNGFLLYHSSFFLMRHKHKHFDFFLSNYRCCKKKKKAYNVRFDENLFIILFKEFSVHTFMCKILKKNNWLKSCWFELFFKT